MTPSPILKPSSITEIEMKRVSVAVHLWAERKMGGVKFLHNTRLTDSHFEDILMFTGPGSNWNLMKETTLKQLRCLWRNTFGGKKYYRGHKKTGFENEAQRHTQSDQFCPFGHCSSGVMSPMDIDLIVLTPKRSTPLLLEKKATLSSRKLFETNEEMEESAPSNEENATSYEETDKEALESVSIDDPNDVNESEEKDRKKIMYQVQKL